MQFIVEDPVLLEADRMSEPSVAVVAALGGTHGFYPSVGSHTALALRERGESLRIMVHRSDGTEAQIGTIPSFPAGSVAVIRVTAGQDGDPVAEVEAIRDATELERSYALGQGVNPDGTITSER